MSERPWYRLHGWTWVYVIVTPIFIVVTTFGPLGREILRYHLVHEVPLNKIYFDNSFRIVHEIAWPFRLSSSSD